jgi:Mg-chelatase subunit ChlD
MEALADERRRTISRRDLERNESFSELSPQLGELDEQQFEDMLSEDPDEALELLAKMTQATDGELARLARRLAGRLVLDLTRTGKAKSRGVGKLVRSKATIDAGDIDVDASLEQLTAAKAEGRPPAIDELITTSWQRPHTAICLLIDRSGSMSGERLASAEFAVMAFGAKVVAIKELNEHKAPENVVSEVLALRGHGTTDVELALRAAQLQMRSSRAARKLTILLSDAEVTAGGDPVPAGKALDELTILAPEDDPDHAKALAADCGARLAEVGGPFSVLDSLRTLVQ